MHLTQEITRDWLRNSGLEGDQLLLEALLRRGFLAFRDEQGVWLGTGSHPEDLNVLRLVDDLQVETVSDHRDRLASIWFCSGNMSQIDVASRIVELPEHHGFTSGSHCPIGRWGDSWVSYKNMVWGIKVATCPTRFQPAHRVGYTGLDIGVALLVKVLPLSRVATHFSSCDGHGQGPAYVGLRHPWDGMWGKAVFDTLKIPMLNTEWRWGCGVRVASNSGYDFQSVLAMLNDIQSYARALLDQSVIDRVGIARKKTIAAFPNTAPPSNDAFDLEALKNLAEVFAQ